MSKFDNSVMVPVSVLDGRGIAPGGHSERSGRKWRFRLDVSPVTDDGKVGFLATVESVTTGVCRTASGPNPSVAFRACLAAHGKPQAVNGWKVCGLSEDTGAKGGIGVVRVSKKRHSGWALLAYLAETEFGMTKDDIIEFVSRPEVHENIDQGKVNGELREAGYYNDIAAAAADAHKKAMEARAEKKSASKKKSAAVKKLEAARASLLAMGLDVTAIDEQLTALRAA